MEGGATFLDSPLEVTWCLLPGVCLLLAPLLLPCSPHKGMSHPKGVRWWLCLLWVHCRLCGRGCCCLVLLLVPCGS